MTYSRLNDTFGSLNGRYHHRGPSALAGLAVSVAGRPARDRPTGRASGKTGIAEPKPSCGSSTADLSGTGILATFTQVLPNPRRDALGHPARPGHDESSTSLSDREQTFSTRRPGWSDFSRGRPLSELPDHRRQHDPVSHPKMVSYTLSGAAAGAVVAGHRSPNTCRVWPRSPMHRSSSAFCSTATTGYTWSWPPASPGRCSPS